MTISLSFMRKNCCSFGFCPNQGGGRALPKFFGSFSLVHFWSIKGVCFLQNANNLNFTLFFSGRIHDPQSKYSVFISLAGARLPSAPTGGGQPQLPHPHLKILPKQMNFGQVKKDFFRFCLGLSPTWGGG